MPKEEFYQISLDPRSGIDPFLRYSEIIVDTEGTKPIEATIELPPGVIVTGRLVDKATGQAVPAASVGYIKAADNVSTGDAPLGFSRLADGTFALTVPPGPAMIAAIAKTITRRMTRTYTTA